MNIDVMSSSFSANVAKALNKQKPVYVYCRSGHRSMTAASVLAGEGFRVVNLSGGIMEWMGSGKAVSR
jgi:rhodanese-related sulfurtransferase